MQVLNALAGGDTTFAHVLGKAVRDHPNIAGSEIALVALVQVCDHAEQQDWMLSSAAWQRPARCCLRYRIAARSAV